MIQSLWLPVIDDRQRVHDLELAVNTSCLEETRPRRMVDDFERWFVDV
jgi:hypothetical protein